MSVDLTEKAAAEVARIMKEQSLDPATSYLRFGIQGGGCSGFEYVLGFVDSFSVPDVDKDALLESRGVKILSDEKSLEMADGTEIDFESDVMNRKFVFNNPKASRSCGCGTSFSV